MLLKEKTENPTLEPTLSNLTLNVKKVYLKRWIKFFGEFNLQNCKN